MDNNIKLTPEAIKAIQALQHPRGTYQFYRSHLDRLFFYILDNSDEIGMSDNEAMGTLRALNAIRADIADIANMHVIVTNQADTGCAADGTEDSAGINERVGAVFDNLPALNAASSTDDIRHTTQ